MIAKAIIRILENFLILIFPSLVAFFTGIMYNSYIAYAQQENYPLPDETIQPIIVYVPPTPLPTPIQPEPTPQPKIYFSSADTLKALAYASPLAKCIIRHEVGGGTKIYPPWFPYSIGAAGELGVAQLLPRGKLPEFYKLGYTNPFDPYQSIEYLEDALKRGQKYHWTSVVKGWC